MSDSTEHSAEQPQQQPLSAQARIIEGVTGSGKPCRLVDNTGEIAEAELQQLLQELISNNQFGVKLLSEAGASQIRLDQARFSHIQIGENLYRLILFPFEARIETF